MKPVALVTGGNRGIGRAIVLALARRGFDIAIVDREASDDGEQTLREAEACGARTLFVAADIAELHTHPAIIDRTLAFAGRLDVLVNNAGVSVAVRGDLLDITPERYDRVLDVNLRGTFFLSQAVARAMLGAGPGPADGLPPRSIITISSINAVIVAPDRAEYCLSKTGLSMMVKLFAARLGAAGIACYEVRPGVIRTEMTRVAAARYDRLIADGLTPFARWGEPEDVGRAVATLACGDLPFMTGDALHIDGGLHLHRL